MKRIYLTGAAAAALFTAGLTAAPAFGSPANKPRTVHQKLVFGNKRVTTKLSCALTLVTQIPSDDTTVIQGAPAGTQSGRASCAKPLFVGIDATTFLQDDAGDVQGQYQQWFNLGSIYGNYTLTPTDTAPPTTTSFTAASYTGTIKVRNGTGLFNKVVGIGTIGCSTVDSAHFTCTENLKLVQTVRVLIRTRKR